MSDIFGEIDNFLKSGESLADPFANFGEGAVGLAERIATDSAAELSAGTGAAESLLVEGAASALADVVGGVISIVVIAIAYAMHVLDNAIQSLLIRLPGPMGAYFRAHHKTFSGLAVLSTPIANTAVRHASKLLRAHVNLIHTASSITAPFFGPVSKNPNVNASVENVHYLQQEIQQLQYELDHIKRTVSVTSVTNNTTNVVNPQIWPEIHALQSDVHHLQSAMTDVYSTLERQQALIESLGHQFNSLTGELHGVRSVITGWQDVQREIEEQVTTLTHLYNEERTTNHTQTRQIAQLSPLALLLQPGIRGLRNLRKLEDNPCQCPRFGNIPNELGTALAVMEFVENG